MTQNEKTPNLIADAGHAKLTPTLNSIRERAYQKWQAAGRPTGDNVCFWEEAEQELLQERLRA
jgi:hypothetical protein